MMLRPVRRNSSTHVGSAISSVSTSLAVDDARPRYVTAHAPASLDSSSMKMVASGKAPMKGTSCGLGGVSSCEKRFSSTRFW